MSAQVPLNEPVVKSESVGATKMTPPVEETPKVAPVSEVQEPRPQEQREAKSKKKRSPKVCYVSFNLSRLRLSQK